MVKGVLDKLFCLMYFFTGTAAARGGCNMMEKDVHSEC